MIGCSLNGVGCIRAKYVDWNWGVAVENAALMSCVSGGEMRLISVCIYKVVGELVHVLRSLFAASLFSVWPVDVRVGIKALYVVCC